MPYDPARHGPHRIVGPGFRERVYRVVGLVPAGRVSTYGDVGSALGSPTVARQVGFALAALPASRRDVPWHRVVNARGCISFRGDDERGAAQRRRLLAEGIAFDAAERVARFAELRFSFEGPLFEEEEDAP